MRSPGDDSPISPPVLRGHNNNKQRPMRSESRVLAMRSRFERMTEAEEVMAEMEELTRMQNKVKQEEDAMENHKKPEQDKSKRYAYFKLLVFVYRYRLHN